MKILMISSYLPYPLFSGGAVRLYNLIEKLSQHHEITLICEKRSNQNEGDIAAVEKICKKVICVNREKQWSVKNIIKSGLSSSPFLVTGHTTHAFATAIQTELIENSYNIIHAETFYVMQNLPQDVSIPVALVEHNIEYLVYDRYTQNAKPFLRPLLSIDIAKIKRSEERAWEKASKVVFVSKQEKEQSGVKDAEVVPNGVDVSKFTVHSSQFTAKEKKLLFIGDFKWIQNRDAVKWIIEKLWPRVGSLSPQSSLKERGGRKEDIKLWIVGKNIPDEILSIKDPNIIFDSNADDTSKVFSEAFCLIAPIRVGGGTSFKILEAMASGCPVITTKLGNEGIDAEDKKSVLIADSAQEFQDAIELLLSSEKKYNEIRKAARSHIEKNFDWNEIAKKLEKVYERMKREW